MTRFPLPFLRSFLRRSGQQQARSRWLSLSFANFDFLQAIATWDWIADFRSSYKVYLSIAKTEPSHGNLIVNFREIKEQRVVRNCELPIVNYQLRIANYQLRLAN